MLYEERRQDTTSGYHYPLLEYIDLWFSKIDKLGFNFSSLSVVGLVHFHNSWRHQ